MAPPFPLAAAEEARQRWDELAPFFVAELERVADGGSTLLDENSWEYDGLFSFAAYLAAEKRDSRAYGPLVRACHCSTERAHALFGADLGNQLGRMLASVCDDVIAPLKALAEDRAADMWCRYAALLEIIRGWFDEDLIDPSVTGLSNLPKVGRNDPCPCGSGKKFKKCCGKEANEPVAGEDKDGGVGRALDRNG